MFFELTDATLAYVDALVGLFLFLASRLFFTVSTMSSSTSSTGL